MGIIGDHSAVSRRMLERRKFILLQTFPDEGFVCDLEAMVIILDSIKFNNHEFIGEIFDDQEISLDSCQPAGSSW